jgi:trehalose-6-phosphate synthase
MPHVITAQFWHIPWPNPEVFRICPWQEEILDGLLGNDLLGFHTRPQRNNFLESVDLAMEANVDRERYAVTRRGQKTSVGFFPISIDFQRMNEDAQQIDVEEEMRRIGMALRVDGKIIGLGLDRFDYIKGITERVRAFDRFLARYPEYRGRVVFIQVGTQSRTQISAYQQFSDEMEGLIQDINGRWAYGDWEPILRLHDVSPKALLALRRMAHFSIVSPLHDGMNLVAKEFVASRFDESGVLILSPFTGAARELTDALLVNPYATDQFAEAIKTAIEMPKEEQGKRMKRMRQVVEENNVYKWATDIISEIAKV